MSYCWRAGRMPPHHWQLSSYESPDRISRLEVGLGRSQRKQLSHPILPLYKLGREKNLVILISLSLSSHAEGSIAPLSQTMSTFPLSFSAISMKVVSSWRMVFRILHWKSNACSFVAFAKSTPPLHFII